VKRSEESDTLRLLYLGRLHPIKAIDSLLEACRLLAEEPGLQWSLVIAGDGDTRYTGALRNQAAAYGLNRQIEFVGQLSGEQKEATLARADVLVLPSHVENFGMVVAEALSRGIPVIASRGTPWAQVETIGCGLWVDNSPESLADAIRRMRREPLAAMGAAGRAWMQRQFSWRAIAERMTELYRSIMPGAEQALRT
jgi:glycosyltransferase involved in cell wall biosynthesis